MLVVLRKTTRQLISYYEKSESEDRISLGRLRRIADAMDCELVYVIIPKSGTLLQLAERKTRDEATERVLSVEHSMALENQAVGRTKELIDSETKKVSQKTPVVIMKPGELNQGPRNAPIDPDELDGLIPDLSLKRELDEFERKNILDGYNWALSPRRLRFRDPLTEPYVRELHRRMFDQTWKWAGRYRNTEKKIGVLVHEIRNNIPMLLRRRTILARE